MSKLGILKDVDVGLTLVLCDFSAKLGELASLSKGDVLALGIPDGGVEFEARCENGAPLFTGEVVSIEGELCLRVTEVAPPRSG